MKWFGVAVKYIFFIISSLLVNPAFAVTLIKFRSMPENVSIQQFDISPKKITFKKETNFFDQKVDYELGTYVLNPDTDIKNIEKQLDQVLEKIKTVDKFLRDTKGSSFNEINPPASHDTYFVLDSFKISEASNLYPAIDKVFKSMQSEEKKLLDGVSLDQKLGLINLKKDGKIISSSKFTMDNCLKPTLPTVCKFKNYGVLYVDPMEGKK